MALLKIKNYDFSRQQKTFLAKEIGAGQTALYIENGSGFAANDFIVIDPLKERAEVRKITTVDSARQFTLASGTNFVHLKGVQVFRLPYNQLKVYDSTAAGGTYTIIDTVDADYSSVDTNYEYNANTTGYYYKATYYNSVTDTESTIGESFYWQVTDMDLYMPVGEMRVHLQFSDIDYPKFNDMYTIMRLAQDKVDLDISTSDPRILRLALFLLGKSKIFRSLASKSIAKGYVTINAEGRNITKAYQELVLEAENTEQDYEQLIKALLTNEVTCTNFMHDTVSDDIVQRYKDIMFGVSNALEYEKDINFGFRARSGE